MDSRKVKGILMLGISIPMFVAAMLGSLIIVLGGVVGNGYRYQALLPLGVIAGVCLFTLIAITMMEKE